MKPTFNIQTCVAATAESKLLLYISKQEISYVVIDANLACNAIGSYHFTAEPTNEAVTEGLKKIVEGNVILQTSFKKVEIVYAFAEAALIPTAWMIDNGKKDLLELLHGDQADVFIRTDYLIDQAIHNVYAVPRQIDEMLNYLFVSVVSTHLYSILPCIKLPSEYYLYCIFGSNCFTVIFQIDSKLQVIQSYSFKTPEDVSYHLLQLCEAYEINKQSLTVYLNGMIDPTSVLFDELNKYFIQVQFQELPEVFVYPEEMQTFPTHYFSHLFEIAQCV